MTTQPAGIPSILQVLRGLPLFEGVSQAGLAALARANRWSEQFLPQTIHELNAFGPMAGITPEWAWGGSAGAEVRVAWKDRHYVTSTGNSFAAPHIAGIVTLIKFKHPEMTPFQVKSILWACAANVRRDPIQPAESS